MPVALQGGALLFDGERVLFRHDDSGILKYVDVEALVEAATRAALPAPAPTL